MAGQSDGRAVGSANIPRDCRLGERGRLRARGSRSRLLSGLVGALVTIYAGMGRHQLQVELAEQDCQPRPHGGAHRGFLCGWALPQCRERRLGACAKDDRGAQVPQVVALMAERSAAISAL